MNIGFHHGALCDSYEEQANAQGFTFGDKAEWVQKVGFGLVCAHIHGCITDSEYDKILRRFQTKILLKNIKPLERSERMIIIDDDGVMHKVLQVDTLDQIRYEIEANAYPIVHGVNNHEKGMTLYGIMQIIDKYRNEVSE